MKRKIVESVFFFQVGKKIYRENVTTKAITLLFFCLKKMTVIKLYRKMELKTRGDDKKERGNKNQRSETYQYSSAEVGIFFLPTFCRLFFFNQMFFFEFLFIPFFVFLENRPADCFADFFFCRLPHYCSEQYKLFQ